MTSNTHVPLSSENLTVVMVLTFLLFIGLLGTDIHLSALPEMMNFMNTNKKLMQSSISIFLLGIGMSSLIYGPLSDKYGRKPIIIIGLFIAIVGNLWAATLSTIEPFLIARFVQGIGCGVCIALPRIVLSDIVQGERYAITSSYITLFTGLSIVLGPVLGSFVQTCYGWRANFIIMALMISFMLIIYSCLCPETNKYKNQLIKLSDFFINYKEVLQNKMFLFATLLSGIGMSCFIMYTTSSSFILQNQFELSPTEYGWMSAFVGSGLLMSRVLLPNFIKRYGMKKMVFTGLFILIISGSSLLIFSKLGHLTMALFIFSIAGIFFSYTFIVLCASAISMTPFTDKRGSAGAVYSCSQMALAFLVNSIVSSLSDNAVEILGISYIVLPVLGIYLLRKI